MSEKENKKVARLTKAVEDIKTAILRSQLRSASIVNADMLSLYYGIGKYVSEHSRNGYWGTGAIATISKQLQQELPGLRGFSEESIKKMRLFYEAWQPVINRSPAATDLEAPNESTDFRSPSATEIVINEAINVYALLQMRPHSEVAINPIEFLGIGFTHHMEILRKTNTLEERNFYIHQTYQSRWNKDILREMLKNDVFHHQSMMSNNFSKTIANPKFAQKAIAMFRDEYLVDYISVEEMDESESDIVDERVIERSIVKNIKKFILTFGNDFTFIGNQYRLEGAGREFFIDLLFFNRELNCLCAVELKNGEFKAPYLGQLQTYLRLLDMNVKKPHENPSIGIILCRSVDKQFVELVIQDYDKPMGVATYRTSADMPAKLRKALPNIEDLRKLL